MIAAREVATAARVRLTAWPEANLSALIDANDAVICCTRVPGGRAAVDTRVREILGDARAAAMAAAMAAAPGLVGGDCASIPAPLGGLRANVHLGVRSRVTTTILPQTDLARGPGGKPYIAADARLPLNFNISHSGDVLVVALSRTAELGVDIERVRAIPEWRRIANRMFDAETCARLLGDVAYGVDEDDAFIRQWCRLEAMVKATGEGLFARDARDDAIDRTTDRTNLLVIDLPHLPLPAGTSRYRGALALCQ